MSFLNKYLDRNLFIIFIISHSTGCAGTLTDQQYNNFPINKAVAVQVDTNGNKISGPAYGVCYGKPTLETARSCAISTCKAYSNNNGICLLAAENNRQVIDQSIASYREERIKKQIASFRRQCEGMGFKNETDLNACIISQASSSSSTASPQNRGAPNNSTPNYDAIGQLGRDILNGKAWPAPQKSVPNSRPSRPANSCLQSGWYMSADGKYKICQYTCGQTRTVSQYSMCPLIP